MLEEKTVFLKYTIIFLFYLFNSIYSDPGVFSQVIYKNLILGLFTI